MDVTTKEDPTEKVDELTRILHEKVEEFFPSKIVKKLDKDPEWMTFQLQKLKRRKMREYQKRGNSSKYKVNI